MAVPAESVGIINLSRKKAILLRKYEEFISIARNLNNQLGMIPLLYGSLGLQVESGIDFYADDIDVLIPKKFLEESWAEFKRALESMGYTLINLHEHEFIKDDMKVAFAGIEGLYDFAGIDYKSIEVVELDAAKYKRLSLEDYLKVYTKSSFDSYRRTKNNDKDLKKIQLLKQVLD